MLALDTGGPVAFSPDGTRAALAYGKSVKVVEERDGREVAVLPDGKGTVVALVFAEGGKEVCTVTFEDSTLHRWDIAGGKELAAFPLQGGLFSINRPGPYRPSFSPDGRWLAAGGDRGSVRVWDAATGQRQHDDTNGPLMH